MARRIVIYSIGIALTLVGLGYLRSWSYSRSMERRVAPIVCRDNLKLISIAKAQWAQEHNKTTNDIPTWSELLEANGCLKGRKPECRSGGFYVIGRIGVSPQCSIPEHNLP